MQINHFSTGKGRELVQSMGKSVDNSDHFPLFFTGEPLELNVTLDIWEGNVTVLWDPPKGAPVYALYQVKTAL